MNNQNGGNNRRAPRRGGLLPSEMKLRDFMAKQQLKSMKAALAIHAAADKGRKNRDWRASPGSADLAIIPDSEILNARARQLVRDSWPAKSVVKAYVRNIVGPGILTTPHAKSEDGKPLTAFNRRAKAGFDHWAKAKVVCDVEKKQTFFQKQGLAVSERATVGEHFIVWSYEPPLTPGGRTDYSLPVGLRLQSFEPEQLDLRVLSFEGREVRGGIELDDNGAAVAYHFYTRNPNDFLYRKAFWSKRVPRERVFHYYRQERVLQTRGVTPLSPVMNDIREHARYREATIWRAVMEACIGLVIRKPYPTGSNPNSPLSFPFTGADPTGQTQSGMRTMDMVPGMVGELLPGEDVTTVAPSTPGNGFEPFVRATLQGVGAGTGMSLGQITRQSDSNYSAARQDMLTDRQEWEPEQQLLVDDLIRPIYNLWLDFAVLEGRFDDVKDFEAGDYVSERYRFQEADFTPPPQTWIDPEKEANAFAVLLKNRLITREEIVAMRGQRFAVVVNKLAEEKNATDDLGMTFPEDAQDRTELRDLIKGYFAEKTGTVGVAIANATDNEALLEAVGVPVQRGYEQPELPIPEAPAPSPAPKKPAVSLAERVLAPNYKAAKDPAAMSCQTCSRNAAGMCKLYEFTVTPNNVCESWSAVPIAEGDAPGTKGFPPGPPEGSPGIDRDFQSDAARQDVGIV